MTNIDKSILEYVGERDEPPTEQEIVDAVAPRPKNHASYALVLMRIQSLQRKGELYSPSGPTRYDRP